MDQKQFHKLTEIIRKFEKRVEKIIVTTTFVLSKTKNTDEPNDTIDRRGRK